MVGAAALGLKRAVRAPDVKDSNGSRIRLHQRRGWVDLSGSHPSREGGRTKPLARQWRLWLAVRFLIDVGSLCLGFLA
ncbi:hypothetical protein, partial [Sinorhizobium terangae]|uniref:hypothetical protein n=1 Tax=Sinorhizobium terangae TaxID=110322 RepID=UPI001AEE08EF